MQKKAFTILELLIIVVILGIIFSMSRNFFNVSRQKKLVFGEGCVNYIYGEVDKFVTDVQYGKMPVNTGAIKAYSISFYGANTGSFLSSSGFGALLFQGLDIDYVPTTTYKGISLSSNNFAPINNLAIPSLCYSNEFTVTGIPSIPGTSILQVSIPAVKSDTSQRFIGEEQETNLQPSITGEIVYSVCSLLKGQTNPTWATMLDTTQCIQIAKITADRRSESINFLKCGRINDQTGICQSRPRIY